MLMHKKMRGKEDKDFIKKQYLLRKIAKRERRKA